VDVPQVWERLVQGESGAGRITLFDAERFPVRMAAEVRDWDLARFVDDAGPWQRHARQTQFALAAALAAHRATGLADTAVDPLRLGVFLGCGEIFPDFHEFCRTIGRSLPDGTFELDRFIRETYRSARSDDELIIEPAAAAACIAGRFNAQGPHGNFTVACVSSSKAISEAAAAIRDGAADIMFCGGAHSMIHPFGMTGFHRLSTLSARNDDPQRAMRPFDRNRDGFVMGEGGAILVLEALEHARRRGADIWAELTGAAVTHDAYRVTDLDPEGRAAARCISLALADAQLMPEDIDYINAHGTATQINDRAESLATKRALGNCAYHIPISSTKSMTGHLTTACGAIEALACIMAIRTGLVPPTINYEEPDPECDLDYVPNVAREVRCRNVISNSFGFGGHNVSLVFSGCS
jgi:3-oxoacyl-[acyl-carrier-protein] synthase II